MTRTDPRRALPSVDAVLRAGRPSDAERDRFTRAAREVLTRARGLRATVRMKNDDFGRYLALGLTVIVVVQGFMHMSVVLGMMPTKGIPLPMISFGGSSLLSTLTCLGILLNVSEHAG